MDDSNEPVDLEVKRDEGVTIRFADGQVARIGLMELRLGCPCATCRSLRERGEDIDARVTHHERIIGRTGVKDDHAECRQCAQVLNRQKLPRGTGDWSGYLHSIAI